MTTRNNVSCLHHLDSISFLAFADGKFEFELTKRKLNFDIWLYICMYFFYATFSSSCLYWRTDWHLETMNKCQIGEHKLHQFLLDNKHFRHSLLSIFACHIKSKTASSAFYVCYLHNKTCIFYFNIMVMHSIVTTTTNK